MPKTNPIDGGSGGGSVDLSGVESRLDALETGPTMIGVGENGERTTAIFLEDTPNPDKAVKVKGPDDVERFI